jgi:hypothetical protein
LEVIMANRFPHMATTQSLASIDLGTVQAQHPQARPEPTAQFLATGQFQARILDAALGILGAEQQAGNTATYLRLWRVHLALRKLVRSAPHALRFLAGPPPSDPGREPAHLRIFRTRLDRAVQDILVEGIAKAELRPDLDLNGVGEWFLMLSTAPGDDQADGSGLNLAVFDMFWWGIATQMSARRRAS